MNGLETLAKKIQDVLIRRSKIGALPKNMFELGLMFTLELKKEDFKEFDAIEAEIGEEKANEWLVGVMVASGQYETDGSNVWIKAA